MSRLNFGLVVLQGSLGEQGYRRLKDTTERLCARLNLHLEKTDLFRFEVCPSGPEDDLGVDDSELASVPADASERQASDGEVMSGAALPHNPPTDDNRGYSGEVLWKWLGRAKQFSKKDRVIGVTSEILERGSFNRENPDRTCGVITLAEWEAFVPPGLNQLDYLEYLAICEAILLRAGPNLKEHPRQDACLFDVCRDRNQLTFGLRKAHIDSECVYILKENFGFTDSHIEHIQTALRDVRAIDWYLYSTSLGRHSLPFFAGAAVSFCASIVANLYTRTGVAIAAALLGACFWLAIAKVSSARRIRRPRRRVVQILHVALLPALCGLFIFAALKIPLPESQMIRIEESPTADSVPSSPSTTRP